MINQIDEEIWYKKPSADDKANEADMCPPGFTRLSTGCFHVGPTTSDWDYGRNTYCRSLAPPQSHLAVFGSIEVSS